MAAKPGQMPRLGLDNPAPCRHSARILRQPAITGRTTARMGMALVGLVSILLLIAILPV